VKKRGIRIALKGGHEFYQKGYSKEENFQYFQALRKVNLLKINNNNYEKCCTHQTQQIGQMLLLEV